MSNLVRMAMRLYNRAQLISPDKIDVIEGIFRARFEGATPTLFRDDDASIPKVENFAAMAGMREAPAGYFVNDSTGIALVGVVGTLVQRAGGMDAASGMTSYQQISGQIGAALNDPRVRGIVLDVDSPGGEGAGVFELAKEIRGASDVKPIFALANEGAFSAGYALASAAEQLFVPSAGMVGSIGVILMHVDQSQLDAKRGLVVTPIYAGARKADFNSHAPLSPEARASAQAIVDRMYDTFVSTVAAHRPIDAKAVRGTEAGLFGSADAKAIGLVDDTANLSEVMQHMADAMKPSASRKKSGSAAAGSSASNQKGALTMSTEANTNAPAQPSAADLEKARGEAQSAGANAERERVKAIMNSEPAKDRPALANHLAFETAMTSAEAIALLGKAAPETKPQASTEPKETPLNRRMKAVGNANVGADPDPDAPHKFSTATDIYAKRRDNVRQFIGRAK